MSDTKELHALFRHYCGVISRRVRERPRCRRCFAHGWVHGKLTITGHCDGCAEMEDFIAQARDAFAKERKTVRRGKSKKEDAQ